MVVALALRFGSPGVLKQLCSPPVETAAAAVAVFLHKHPVVVSRRTPQGCAWPSRNATCEWNHAADMGRLA